MTSYRGLGVIFIVMSSACGSSSGTQASTADAGHDAGPCGTAADAGAPASVPLTGLEAGYSFDDLRYSRALHAMMVPGGYSGNIYLVDPDTLAVTSIGGFTKGTMASGTLGASTVDEGMGYLFVGDRTQPYTLSVVDPKLKTILAQVPTAGYPDYVRYVPSRNEVWVEEAFQLQVEIFTLPTSGTPIPTHAAIISPGGVTEGLGVDTKTGKVFSHDLLGPAIWEMDSATRTKTGTWSLACAASSQGNTTHGNATVDSDRGFVFAGCADAKVTVLDESTGKVLDTYNLGPGASLSAYSPELHHFYFRADNALPVAMFDVASTGKLSLLTKVPSVMVGHCLAADDRHHVWTCDAAKGAVLRLDDAFAACP
jgi:outer membrane protein assembly factor BamB